MTIMDWVLIAMICTIVYLCWAWKREMEKTWERIEKKTPEEKAKMAGSLDSANWL